MVSIHGRFGLRSWASMILGLLLFLVGAIPLANKFGWIAFQMPELSQFILRILFIAAGLFLIWDATHEIYNNRAFMILSLVFGIPVLILGLIPLLHQYGVIGFTLPLSGFIILDLLTAIAGLVLFLDAWKSE